MRLILGTRPQRSTPGEPRFRARIAFALDGGELVEAPRAPRIAMEVFPWIGLTRGGDQVTLQRIERLGPEEE